MKRLTSFANIFLITPNTISGTPEKYTGATGLGHLYGDLDTCFGSSLSFSAGYGPLVSTFPYRTFATFPLFSSLAHRHSGVTQRVHVTANFRKLSLNVGGHRSEAAEARGATVRGVEDLCQNRWALIAQDFVILETGTQDIAIRVLVPYYSRGEMGETMLRQTRNGSCKNLGHVPLRQHCFNSKLFPATCPFDEWGKLVGKRSNYIFVLLIKLVGWLKLRRLSTNCVGQVVGMQHLFWLDAPCISERRCIR